MLAALSFLAAGWRDSLAAPEVSLPSHGAGTRSLILDVVINGTHIGLLGEFQEKQGEIYAARKEFDALGFRLPPGTPEAGPDTLIKLRNVPGLTTRVDENSQTIYVTTEARNLKPNELGPQASLASTLPVKSGFGAVVNYDIAGTYVAHRALGDLLFDGRIFTPWAVAESSFTATNANGLQPAPVVRLDTTVTASDTARLTQYQLGDLISGGLEWSRPVRLGGFQISTNFGIRPDLMTYPVPTITGEVAVPSSVDVLVNGIQELSQPVPAGPFEIRQLPVVTGVGDVSVVVRNAAGQQSTQTLQLYISRQLMAPGLDSFSAEFGLVRLNFGTLSDDYRAPAGSASYRYGLTKWLTLEAHAEASDSGGSYQGVAIAPGGMAGGGVVLALGPLGVVSGDIAGSRFGHRSGGLASVGFERIAPHVSLSLSAQATAGKFGDIASDYGDPVPNLQARAVLGFSWETTGSFGLAYTVQRRPASLATQTELSSVNAARTDTGGDFGLVPLVLASKISLISLSYSRPFFHERAFLSATAFHDFADSGASGATVSLIFPLGRRNSISVEGDADSTGGNGVLQATRSSSEFGDYGYQLREEAGEQSRQIAQANYRAPWGLLEAGMDHSSSGTALRGDLQGAIAFAAGGAFPSLPITDSFAVVDTDGTPGVHVEQENRIVGRTDANGQLLVTDLRAFDANRLGVDPADIPVDADAGPTTQLVRPRDRSGVVVHFRMKPGLGAVVALQDRSGKPVQLGSKVVLEGNTETQSLVVGYDGEVFATGLQPHNHMIVVLPDGSRCGAAFDFVRQPGRIPRIGPLLCRALPP